MTERTPQRAYLDLQKLAREQGRNTQQLFELYIHERFLARLAESRFADKLILKGGLLLAVLDVRRATRDADVLVRGVAGDEGSLRSAVGKIASIPMADGVEFDTDAISIAPIREGADYEGRRLALPASLAGAKLQLRLDLSFGDPVEPQRVESTPATATTGMSTCSRRFIQLKPRFCRALSADGLQNTQDSAWNPATRRWE